MRAPLATVAAFAIVAVAVPASAQQAAPVPLGDEAMSAPRSPRVGIAVGGGAFFGTIPALNVLPVFVGRGRIGNQFDSAWGLMGEAHVHLGTATVVGLNAIVQWNAPRYFFVAFGGGIGGLLNASMTNGTTSTMTGTETTGTTGTVAPASTAGTTGNAMSQLFGSGIARVGIDFPLAPPRPDAAGDNVPAVDHARASAISLALETQVLVNGNGVAVAPSLLVGFEVY